MFNNTTNVLQTSNAMEVIENDGPGQTLPQVNYQFTKENLWQHRQQEAARQQSLAPNMEEKAPSNRKGKYPILSH